ncbi:MarR family winged helix-turn-helix transcriptional regulator [Arthrobacter zhaoguopingii]|uniref:MarR family winged helix-turn-helix transcriptional regulator n=1 Tax=Arthrobacter zhaoguopingii TaxID=2681491 RepID=UPI001359A48A|nr:MarR family winged helix-turn-helix transcriptional regulator [Arthrobacter zhaoguopingii]
MKKSPGPDAYGSATSEGLEAHQLSSALRELHRRFSDFESETARRMGLRAPDFSAMEHILEADGGMGPAQLSARLGLAPGSTTELVDRLERVGHLERVRDVRDRRRVNLQATPESVAAILAHIVPVVEQLDDLAEEFTDDEQEVISRYLAGAGERVQRFLETGRPQTGR